MSSTSSTRGARDHARAQAGTRVVSQPTLPASAAEGLPPAIDAATLIWDETLGDGAYAAHRLPRGTRLRLHDAGGSGCLTLMVHSAADPAERLNVADTVKVQWNAYLGPGTLLLSDMGRALMAVEADGSGRHDALCGPHPGSRGRLLLAMAKHGLGRRDLPPAVTLFTGVRVGADGSLAYDGSPRPGGEVVLRAEMDVLVSMVNAPHRLERAERHVCSPVRATAWRGAPTAPDDPLRTATPERARAYENTDDLLLSLGALP
jgi:uncharacterized protein